jgi:LPXTG-motif cell wall-anchored protein
MNQNGEQGAVRTGDETPVVPMLMTMFLSGLAAVYLVLRRRRSNSKREA